MEPKGSLTHLWACHLSLSWLAFEYILQHYSAKDTDF